MRDCPRELWRRRIRPECVIERDDDASAYPNYDVSSGPHDDVSPHHDVDDGPTGLHEFRVLQDGVRRRVRKEVRRARSTDERAPDGCRGAIAHI